MSKTNTQINFVISTLALATVLNGLTGSLTPTYAEQTQSNNQESVEVSNVGLPTHRRDGGTRGGCTANSRDFVALIPETGINRTISNQPKLFFNVPKTEQNQTIEFVLRDQSDRLVYETFINTEGKSGIMSVDIPLAHNQKSLGSGTKYHWYLSNICNPQKRSQDIVLEGSIEYKPITGATKRKLATLPPEEQIKFYQQQGMWHDSLAIAADLVTQPNSTTNSQWSTLLTNVGLEDLVNQPLID